MGIKLISVIVVAAATLLAGCATPARVDQMTVSAAQAAKYANATSPLKKNVAIKDVTGGRETNPMWTSQVDSSGFEAALQESLKATGLLSQHRQTGDYVLTADMGKLEQPMVGFDMTVTASVTYILSERKTGKEVFRRTLATPYTAKVGDAFVGSERLKLANEGAVRVNIEKLTEELYALKFGNITVSSN